MLRGTFSFLGDTSSPICKYKWQKQFSHTCESQFTVKISELHLSLLHFWWKWQWNLGLHWYKCQGKHGLHTLCLYGCGAREWHAPCVRKTHKFSCSVVCFLKFRCWGPNMTSVIINKYCTMKFIHYFTLSDCNKSRKALQSMSRGICVSSPIEAWNNRMIGLQICLMQTLCFKKTHSFSDIRRWNVETKLSKQVSIGFTIEI